MKSSLKTLIAVGALALAATQASASSISVFNGMAPKTVTSSANPDASPPTDSNPAFYQLHTGGTAYASFTLVDTAPEVNTVFYNLYADTDANLGTYTLGTTLASWNFTDILGTGLGGTFSYLLAGASQYVLKIETLSDSVASNTRISAVPLPAAAWLFGSAVLGLGALRRKQKAGANSEMAAA
jgi:hypothetical protein